MSFLPSRQFLPIVCLSARYHQEVPDRNLAECVIFTILVQVIIPGMLPNLNSLPVPGGTEDLSPISTLVTRLPSVPIPESFKYWYTGQRAVHQAVANRQTAPFRNVEREVEIKLTVKSLEFPLTADIELLISILTDLLYRMRMALSLTIKCLHCFPARVDENDRWLCHSETGSHLPRRLYPTVAEKEQLCDLHSE